MEELQPNRATEREEGTDIKICELRSQHEAIRVKSILFKGLKSITFENCSLLGYYTVSSSDFLPTFQDQISRGPTGCPEALVRNYN